MRRAAHWRFPGWQQRPRQPACQVGRGGCERREYAMRQVLIRLPGLRLPPQRRGGWPGRRLPGLGSARGWLVFLPGARLRLPSAGVRLLVCWCVFRGSLRRGLCFCWRGGYRHGFGSCLGLCRGRSSRNSHGHVLGRGTTSGVGSGLGSVATGGTSTGAATGAASACAGGAGASTGTDSGAASASAGGTSASAFNGGVSSGVSSGTVSGVGSGAASASAGAQQRE